MGKCSAQAESLVDPVAGLPCIALFPEDSVWYRAQIRQVLQAGIQVQYVDYGNVAIVPNRLETVRRMRQSLSVEPFYAIRVRLAGVASVDASSWDAVTKATFCSLIANQEFQMECVCSDTDVASVRLTNQDGIDLASHLLA